MKGKWIVIYHPNRLIIHWYESEMKCTRSISITSSSSLASSADFIVLLMILLVLLPLLLLLILDKLDQAGLFRAKLAVASRRLRPYDCPEPRPGTLFVLQKTCWMIFSNEMSMITSRMDMNQVTGWHPPRHDFTVASNTKKFDSGILKALKLASRPSPFLARSSDGKIPSSTGHLL